MSRPIHITQVFCQATFQAREVLHQVLSRISVCLLAYIKEDGDVKGQHMLSQTYTHRPEWDMAVGERMSRQPEAKTCKGIEEIRSGLATSQFMTLFSKVISSL